MVPRMESETLDAGGFRSPASGIAAVLFIVNLQRLGRDLEGKLNSASRSISKTRSFKSMF